MFIDYRFRWIHCKWLFCHYKVSRSQKLEFPTDFSLYRLLSCNKAVSTLPQIFRIYIYLIFLRGMMTGRWYYLINSHKYMYMIIYLFNRHTFTLIHEHVSIVSQAMDLCSIFYTQTSLVNCANSATFIGAIMRYVIKVYLTQYLSLKWSKDFSSFLNDLNLLCVVI